LTEIYYDIADINLVRKFNNKSVEKGPISEFMNSFKFEKNIRI
jgi:hypothetical protein